MTPPEVAAIADLIYSRWSDLPDEEANDVLTSAWRIWNAGYRRVANGGQ